MVLPHPCCFHMSTNRLSRQHSDTWHFFFFPLETPRPGFSLWLQNRLCVRQSLLALCLGACPESVRGVNYHLGGRDLGISASQVGTLHLQHSFDSGSKPDLLAQLLPSVNTWDSGSGYWFQVSSFALSLSR